MGEFIEEFGYLLLKGTFDTLLMTTVSTFFSYVLGIALGVLIYITKPGGLHESRLCYSILNRVINIIRSIPFIILLVALIPITRFLVGTSLGVVGAIVPLVIGSAPFVGRMVEQSLSEVDLSLVEAAQSFGASTIQIIIKVLLKESLPSLIRGASIVFITLFGYSAIAGSIGAGGLGDIAIRYGYQRYQDSVMVAAVVICVVLVELIQGFGDSLACRFDKRN